MKTIPIKSKRYGDHQVLVDDDDYEILSRHIWCLLVKDTSKYARTSIQLKTGENRKQRTLLMHSLILELHAFPPGICDHIDGDGLNNQKVNLRSCSRRQNGKNRHGPQRDGTSGFKGVSFHRASGKYQSRIIVDGDMKHLGVHVDAETAAKVYDEAAKIYHGSFANLNFKQDGFN